MTCHDVINQIQRGNVSSRTSKAGYPTNRPGSDKTRGQGSFGPSTGEPDL